MSDIISIHDLKIQTVIGVHAWEKAIKQPLTLDIQLFTDTKQAALTDDLQHAIDYDSLANHLIEYVQSTSFNLIETLAEKVAELILANTTSKRVMLTLKKPKAIASASHVSLTIERSR